MGICDSENQKIKSPTEYSNSNPNVNANLNYQFANYADSAFDKYDTNRTGYIEYTEFRKVLDDLAGVFSKGENIAEEEVKKNFDLIDTDRDGKISKEEFINSTIFKLLESFKDRQ